MKEKKTSQKDSCYEAEVTKSEKKIMKVKSCKLRININEWLDWCKMVSFMKQAGLVDGFVLEIHTRILQILAATV